MNNGRIDSVFNSLRSKVANERVPILLNTCFRRFIRDAAYQRDRFGKDMGQLETTAADRPLSHFESCILEQIDQDDWKEQSIPAPTQQDFAGIDERLTRDTGMLMRMIQRYDDGGALIPENRSILKALKKKLYSMKSSFDNAILSGLWNRGEKSDKYLGRFIQQVSNEDAAVPYLEQRKELDGPPGARFGK